MVRVAINGFGRIGRMVLRAGINNPEIEFVAVNNLSDTYLTHLLLKHDTVHGPFPGTVTYENDDLIVNGKRIKKLSIREPEELPWKELNIDIVVESTGIFRTKELASKHLIAGAKKVIISAPAKGESYVKTIVKGVNEHTLTKEDDIISNASCTTNCLAPIIKVLNDNYKVNKGFVVTIHAFTADQRLVDTTHRDPRRARAAPNNMIPTTSGAAIAVEKVIPELKDKLKAEAVRVPISDGSMIYFVGELNKSVTKEEVNQLFKNVANYHLKGVLNYNEEPIVSSDIINSPYSSIVDGLLTETNDNMVKVVAWYDNEYGYSNRIIDLILILKKINGFN